MTHTAQHTGSAAETQGIVSFVQALVSSRPQALSEWLASNRLDAALTAWLHGQGMAPFVFYRLRQDQLQAVVSSDALAQLQHAYYLAAPRAALRTRELITVLQALAAHGVVPVLFKGAVLAHTVYPNYVCRPMSDLDLWLSDAEIEVAVHALTQIGYVQRLVDIALLARQQPVDWILVAERARAWRVAAPTWLALELAMTIVGLTEAQPALARLAPSPLRRRVLHLFVNPATLLQRRNITTGPLRFLFLLAMVDRPLAAARLLGRAVWPEEAWLAARYGTGGVRVRVRHTFDAMRGRL